MAYIPPDIHKIKTNQIAIEVAKEANGDLISGFIQVSPSGIVV